MKCDKKEYYTSEGSVVNKLFLLTNNTFTANKYYDILKDRLEKIFV